MDCHAVKVLKNNELKTILSVFAEPTAKELTDSEEIWSGPMKI
jgi:hypothetical protein